MGTPWQIFYDREKKIDAMLLLRIHIHFWQAIIIGTYIFFGGGGLKAVQNSLFTQFFTTGLARELYCVVPFYAVKSASFPSQLADIALQVMSNMNVLCSCLCFCYIYFLQNTVTNCRSSHATMLTILLALLG